MIKHNLYFDGRVQSLAVNTGEGPATIGVIEPGQYTFTTTSEEHMVVIDGIMEVKVQDDKWKEIRKGDKVVIPMNASFDVDAAFDVAYICYYK